MLELAARERQEKAVLRGIYVTGAASVDGVGGPVVMCAVLALTGALRNACQFCRPDIPTSELLSAVPVVLAALVQLGLIALVRRLVRHPGWSAVVNAALLPVLVITWLALHGGLTRLLLSAYCVP